MNRSNRVSNNLLQTHLDNINLLATSVQNRHSLIERMQRQNSIDNLNITSEATNALFDRIFDNNSERPRRSNNSSTQTYPSRDTRINQQNNTYSTTRQRESRYSMYNSRNNSRNNSSNNNSNNSSIMV